MTAAFSEAPTGRDIARVLVNQAHDALHADAAVVLLLDDTGGTLELAAEVGYPRERVDQWKAVPLEAEAPLAEVVRTSAPMFFAQREALLRRYPHMTGRSLGPDDALAAIPPSASGEDRWVR